MTDRIIPIVLACAVSLRSTVQLSNAYHAKPATRADRALATDGAYRDGLYVGRLAAERGLAVRPPTGRWSNQADRESFEAGYRRAFQEHQRP